jgi:hypothetical protein
MQRDRTERADLGDQRLRERDAGRGLAGEEPVDGLHDTRVRQVARDELRAALRARPQRHARLRSTAAVIASSSAITAITTTTAANVCGELPPIRVVS